MKDLKYQLDPFYLGLLQSVNIRCTLDLEPVAETDKENGEEQW